MEVKNTFIVLVGTAFQKVLETFEIRYFQDTGTSLTEIDETTAYQLINQNNNPEA